MTRLDPGPGRLHAPRRASAPLATTLLLVLLGACTGSPGPAPRGSSSVSPTTSMCGVGPYAIPDGESTTMTTATTVGTRVEDGKSGASVECKVKKSGSGYSIRGSLTQDLSFFITGQVDQTGPGTYSGTGSVSFYAPEANTVTSSTCTITVSASQEIGNGKIWGSVSCTNSTASPAAGQSCNFAGSFIFENCAS